MKALLSSETKIQCGSMTLLRITFNLCDYHDLILGKNCNNKIFVNNTSIYFTNAFLGACSKILTTAFNTFQ